MADSQRSPKFFITHSFKDADFARRLADNLRAHDLEGFFDVYSIKPGDNIAERIGRGLEECDVYVPVLSFAALRSRWCREEVNAALTLSNEPGREGRPSIIPVLVEECQSEMPIFLRSRFYINFTGRYEEGVHELLQRGFGVSAKSLSTPAITPPALPVQRRALRADRRLMWAMLVVITALVLIGSGILLDVLAPPQAKAYRWDAAVPYETKELWSVPSGRAILAEIPWPSRAKVLDLFFELANDQPTDVVAFVWPNCADAILAGSKSIGASNTARPIWIHVEKEIYIRDRFCVSLQGTSGTAVKIGVNSESKYLVRVQISAD
jgi:hypothetical protein